MLRLLSLALVALLAACGGGSSRYDDYASDEAADAAADAAAEEAYAVRQAVYEEHGADSDGTGADANNVDAGSVEDSGNYTCTGDCSGHEAGFEWAKEHDISDGSGCGGNSQSFIEGCEAFAEERQEQADTEAQEAAEQAALNADADYSSEGQDEE